MLVEKVKVVINQSILNLIIQIRMLHHQVIIIEMKEAKEMIDLITIIEIIIEIIEIETIEMIETTKEMIETTKEMIETTKEMIETTKEMKELKEMKEIITMIEIIGMIEIIDILMKKIIKEKEKMRVLQTTDQIQDLTINQEIIIDDVSMFQKILDLN